MRSRTPSWSRGLERDRRLGPEGAAARVEVLAQQGLGLGGPARPVEHGGQRVRARSVAGVLRPVERHVELDRGAKVWLGPGVLAEREIGPADPFADRRLDPRAAPWKSPPIRAAARSSISRTVNPAPRGLTSVEDSAIMRSEEIVDRRELRPLVLGLAATSRSTPPSPTTTETTSSAASAAGSGWRRHHIQAARRRADRPGGDRLAASQRSQVVGQGLGAGIAPARVLLQALQADRPPGRAGRRRLTCDGGSGGRSRTLSSVSTQLLPAWGARPVSRA